MFVKEEAALKVAQSLLKIKAIKLSIKTPFTWASGWKSPIYCDNRIILSYPAIRTYIRQQFVKIIREDYGDIDLIAGVATGGIAHGVLVAQDLGLPFAYVRSSAKEHGLAKNIEGVVESGQSVIVIEDLISTGDSSLKAVNALKDAGANVKGIMAIFTYGFDVATENFKNANVDLFTLSNYQNLLNLAVAKRYITEEEEQTLREWNTSPSTWSVEA